MLVSNINEHGYVWYNFKKINVGLGMFQTYILFNLLYLLSTFNSFQYVLVLIISVNKYFL